MNKNGYSIKEMLDFCAERDIDATKEFLAFNQSTKDEYNKLLEKFIAVNSSTSSTTEKGIILEEIATFLVTKTGIFEVYKNVRTSSNEIDLLVKLNEKGKYFLAQGLIDFHEKFLCECKNYDKTISVTWIGKFFSLMRSTKKDLGIIFSYKGFSGKGWNYATGLAKKFFLSQETLIIDFQIEDFISIRNGSNFIEIIKHKIFNLENDTDIKMFIASHPNEDEI